MALGPVPSTSTSPQKVPGTFYLPEVVQEAGKYILDCYTFGLGSTALEKLIHGQRTEGQTTPSQRTTLLSLLLLPVGLILRRVRYGRFRRTFGLRLQNTIEKRDLTQYGLAQKLGIQTSNVTSWVRGFKLPEKKSCRAIEEALQLPHHQVLMWRQEARFHAGDRSLLTILFREVSRIERERGGRPWHNLRKFAETTAAKASRTGRKLSPQEGEKLIILGFRGQVLRDHMELPQTVQGIANFLGTRHNGQLAKFMQNRARRFGLSNSAEWERRFGVNRRYAYRWLNGDLVGEAYHPLVEGALHLPPASLMRRYQRAILSRFGIGLLAA